MERIHAILANGRVITDVEVFRRLYEAVGLGWVYAITKVEPIGNLANAVYGVWAKYRMQVTGREVLEILLQRRQAQTAGSLCNDEDTACEIVSATSSQQQRQL